MRPIHSFRLPQKNRGQWGLYDCLARAWTVHPSKGHSASMVRSIRGAIALEFGRMSTKAKEFRAAVKIAKLGEETKLQAQWDKEHA